MFYIQKNSKILSNQHLLYFYFKEREQKTTHIASPSFIGNENQKQYDIKQIK